MHRRRLAGYLHCHKVPTALQQPATVESKSCWSSSWLGLGCNTKGTAAAQMGVRCTYGTAFDGTRQTMGLSSKVVSMLPGSSYLGFQEGVFPSLVCRCQGAQGLMHTGSPWHEQPAALRTVLASHLVGTLPTHRRTPPTPFSLDTHPSMVSRQHTCPCPDSSAWPKESLPRTQRPSHPSPPPPPQAANCRGLSHLGRLGEMP